MLFLRPTSRAAAAPTAHARFLAAGARPAPPVPRLRLRATAESEGGAGADKADASDGARRGELLGRTGQGGVTPWAMLEVTKSFRIDLVISRDLP